MAPDRWVFLNGDFLPEKQAKVSINDRGFLFGDGIFTTMRVHAGVCELYNGHLRRLEAQAEALDFIFLPWTFIQFKSSFNAIRHGRELGASRSLRQLRMKGKPEQSETSS